jgi:hypothetical protein
MEFQALYLDRWLHVEGTDTGGPRKEGVCSGVGTGPRFQCRELAQYRKPRTSLNKGLRMVVATTRQLVVILAARPTEILLHCHMQELTRSHV